MMLIQTQLASIGITSKILSTNILQAIKCVTSNVPLVSFFASSTLATFQSITLPPVLSSAAWTVFLQSSLILAIWSKFDYFKSQSVVAFIQSNVAILIAFVFGSLGSIMGSALGYHAATQFIQYTTTGGLISDLTQLQLKLIASCIASSYIGGTANFLETSQHLTARFENRKQLQNSLNAVAGIDIGIMIIYFTIITYIQTYSINQCEIDKKKDYSFTKKSIFYRNKLTNTMSTTTTITTNITQNPLLSSYTNISSTSTSNDINSNITNDNMNQTIITVKETASKDDNSSFIVTNYLTTVFNKVISTFRYIFNNNQYNSNHDEMKNDNTSDDSYVDYNYNYYEVGDTSSSDPPVTKLQQTINLLKKTTMKAILYGIPLSTSVGICILSTKLQTLSAIPGVSVIYSTIISLLVAAICTTVFDRITQYTLRPQTRLMTDYCDHLSSLMLTIFYILIGISAKWLDILDVGLPALILLGVSLITHLIFLGIMTTVWNRFVYEIRKKKDSKLTVDLDTLVVASNACIGGSSTAASMANSICRYDLLFSATIVGLIGYIVGTPAGLMLAKYFNINQHIPQMVTKITQVSPKRFLAIF